MEFSRGFDYWTWQIELAEIKKGYAAEQLGRLINQHQDQLPLEPVVVEENIVLGTE